MASSGDCVLRSAHQLLRSALLACYAKGLTGTVAATNDPSPLKFSLESRANSTHSGFAHHARSYVVEIFFHAFRAQISFSATTPLIRETGGGPQQRRLYP